MCVGLWKPLDRASFEHASCHSHQCADLQRKLEAMLIMSKTTLGDEESRFAWELAIGLLVSPPTHFHQTMSHSTVQVKFKTAIFPAAMGLGSVNRKGSLTEPSQHRLPGWSAPVTSKDPKGGSDGWWSGEQWHLNSVATWHQLVNVLAVFVTFWVFFTYKMRWVTENIYRFLFIL